MQYSLNNTVKHSVYLPPLPICRDVSTISLTVSDADYIHSLHPQKFPRIRPYVNMNTIYEVRRKLQNENYEKPT